MDVDVDAPAGMSVAEFLQLAGIRFLDNLSTRRRTTLMAGRTLPVDTKADKIVLACSALPRLRLYEKSCELLSQKTEGALTPQNRKMHALSVAQHI